MTDTYNTADLKIVLSSRTGHKKESVLYDSVSIKLWKMEINP